MKRGGDAANARYRAGCRFCCHRRGTPGVGPFGLGAGAPHWQRRHAKQPLGCRGYRVRCQLAPGHPCCTLRLGRPGDRNRAEARVVVLYSPVVQLAVNSRPNLSAAEDQALTDESQNHRRRISFDTPLPAIGASFHQASGNSPVLGGFLLRPLSIPGDRRRLSFLFVLPHLKTLPNFASGLPNFPLKNRSYASSNCRQMTSRSPRSS
jgi:hypothetical protein